MPIVLVHGVGVRNKDFWPEVDRLLERYIAPAIAPSGRRVEVIRAFWGDLGAHFAWDGASRPLTRILHQGVLARDTQAQRAIASAELHEPLRQLPGSAPSGTGLVQGPRSGSGLSAFPIRLSELSSDELSDLFASTAAQDTRLTPHERAQLVVAVDDVSHDASARRQLAQASTPSQELAKLYELTLAQLRAAGVPAPPVPMGPGAEFGELFVRLQEALSRGNDVPGFAATVVLTEFRKPLNAFLSTFIGDVLTYVTRRGTAKLPGAIPRRVTESLTQARELATQADGEPIVVLSHSMGGQIVYDLVTYYLPAQAPDVKIDFWAATASQVALFEELKLFKVSDPRYSRDSGKLVPFPNAHHLGAWWNVWDPNDALSYTAADIFEGRVIDQQYDSGMSLEAAHGGYLVRPSFFRQFAQKLTAARDQQRPVFGDH